MEIDFTHWKTEFTGMVTREFGARIVCAGVQGSRARGEARETSDIDAVLLLDALTQNDLLNYHALVHRLPYAERMCGFVSGKAELLAWDAADLVSFYFDTDCLIGSLEFLRPRVTPEAARRSVHLSACGLYHALCHAAVFEAEPLSAETVAKSAFFLLRTREYQRTGVYPLRLSELLPLHDPEERALLAPLSGMRPGKANNVFDAAAALDWCSRMIVCCSDA